MTMAYTQEDITKTLEVVEWMIEDHKDHHRYLLELMKSHDFETNEDAFEFYMYNIFGAFAVIGCVAIIAGLFLGLLTLDAMDLQIIQRASIDENERKYAAALIPIVKRRHLLLVTLLILNALAYEALPLFLDKLVPSWVAILLSTTLVLLFGEILPSAIFTGPNQLMLGYHMVPLVRVLLFIMYPFAMPCSTLLDSIVYPDGEDETEEEYNRGELSALVKIQYEKRTRHNKHKLMHKHSRQRFQQQHVPKEQQHQCSTMSSSSGNNGLWRAMKQELLEEVNERKEDSETEVDVENHIRPPMEKQEVDVVVGALQMKTKVATDVYTPLRLVYAIPDDMILDKASMAQLYAQGYSRVPVYHRVTTTENSGTIVGGKDDDDDEEDNSTTRSRVTGYIMTRQLMMIDWDHEREVSTLPLHIPDAVSPRINLVKLLKLLRTGGNLMAFVCARPDLANRAFQKGKPIPIEAGFMGIVTLEDIMESIIQERIYDEVDMKDRDRAVFTLTRWAAEKLQNFARRKKKRHNNQQESNIKRNIIHPPTTSSQTISEKTPLIGNDNKIGTTCYDV